MSDVRVVITGLGVVTNCGIGIDETFETLKAGSLPMKTFDRFAPGNFPCSVAGQIDGFRVRDFLSKKNRKAAKVMARDIEIAVAAADLAFRDAGMSTRDVEEGQSLPANRVGCNIGAGLICCELDELGVAVNSAVGEDGGFDFHAWGKEGMTNLTPLWLLKYLPNMLSCHVTIIHGLEGPSNCITCGDASGLLAAGESALYLKRGTCDAVIVGGAESKLNPMGLLRQGKLQRLVTTKNDTPAEAVRPFDVDHAGTAIGEGGGLAILETLESAQGRDAKMYAEIVGFGAACDPQGTDFLRPTAGNVGQAITGAMKQAGVTPDDVDAIVTYGTGVPGEDVAETAEWAKAMGDRVSEIPAVSTTGATGTMFAGQSGVQLSLAAKMMYENVVLPTANFRTAAEGCELNLSAEARTIELKPIVIAAYTVGGQSAACVLRAI